MKNAESLSHRVLIIDDNEYMRQVLSDALTLRGYHCVAADHGGSALRCLDSDRFHLVISDYQMPIMDGLQLLEALKTRRIPFPPIIMMTGSMSEEFRRRALELGAYAVISKPITPHELAVLSARAIESREIDQSGLSEMRSE